ncbi:hypothetical protein C6988_02505 [Nitrosopumilus sp. b1]|nr:hypothetical protein C6988_02505 [Nitrosopumilus sp. b1]
MYELQYRSLIFYFQLKISTHIGKLKYSDSNNDQNMVEFLIDENILGLDRYLEGMPIKYKKIGDHGCPPKGSKDSTVARFAQENNLVVLTNDDKLTKQCDLLGVDFIFQDLRDFAKKVKEFSDSIDNKK